MKAVKILIGTLAAAYTALGLLRLIEVLVTGTGGELNLASRVVPPAVGGAIALTAFQSALRKPDEPPTEDEAA